MFWLFEKEDTESLLHWLQQKGARKKMSIADLHYSSVVILSLCSCIPSEASETLDADKKC